MLSDILNKEKNTFYLIFNIVSCLLLILILVTVNLGDINIPLGDGLKTFLNRLGLLSYDNLIQETIIFDVRLPRILCAVFIGSGLSVSGAIFQSILRNPLADPYTIGVSSGAAFGAVLAIYLNIVYGILLPTLPFAFAFSILTLYMIMKIAGFNQTLHSSRLILAGIIVSAVFSAGISLLKSMAGEDVSAMIFWLMGRLSAKSWMDILILLPFIMFGLILAIGGADELDALTLGHHEARSIGIDSQKSIRKYLLIAALMTAVCVSISGVIGFVGLVIPHIIRMAFTSKHRYLLPLSALIGALVLLIADNIARLAFQVEIPVGVLTTLIGGPFFIYIYMTKKEIL